MRLIICVDDNDGLMFNKRRQSRDKAVISDILKLTEGKKLYINEYSAALFDDKAAVIVENDFMDVAESDDFCFAENVLLSDYSDRIDEVTVYHWNRVYPTDFKADVDYRKMTLIESVDFEGNSHPKITREVYKR